MQESTDTRYWILYADKGKINVLYRSHVKPEFPHSAY